MFEPAGLALEQLQVVVQLGAGAVAALEPLVASDDRAAVADRDLAGADPDADPQPRKADRDRVAVLAHRDERLRVHARRRRLGRVERVGGQRPQQRPLRRPRLPDRHRPPDDPPAQVSFAALKDERVQLGERRDGRHRHEVVAPEPADLALDAPPSHEPPRSLAW